MQAEAKRMLGEASKLGVNFERAGRSTLTDGARMDGGFANFFWAAIKIVARDFDRNSECETRIEYAVVGG